MTVDEISEAFVRHLDLVKRIRCLGADVNDGYDSAEKEWTACRLINKRLVSTLDAECRRHFALMYDAPWPGDEEQADILEAIILALP